MRRLFILFTLLGSLGLALATSLPASADATHGCSTSGHQYCIGVVGNLGHGNPADQVNPPGRTMEFTFDGNQYCTPDGTICGPEGTLTFLGGSNDCLVAPSGTNIYDGACSGVTGDLWMEDGPVNGKTKWINRYISNLSGFTVALTGDNTLNDHYAVDLINCTHNCYQNFNGPAQN